MLQFMLQKLGNVNRTLRWNASYWYNTATTHDLSNYQPPSNKCEVGWNSVVDVYLRHNNMWENVEEIEEVDDEDDSEIEIDNDVLDDL
jgi:hypothetical protein